MKSINLKKVLPTLAVILFTIPMLTACGEPQFDAALTDTMEINAGNSIVIPAVPEGEAGKDVIAAYAVEGNNIEITEGNMVSGLTEGTATLHVVIINSKGKAAIKNVAVNVLPSSAELLGSLSMTVNGGAVNDGNGASTSAGNDDIKLSLVGDGKWSLVASDGADHTYSSSDTEVLTVTETGEVVINGKGTARINVSSKTDKEIINNGWFEINVIDGHVHQYTEVVTEATCTKKGSKKEVCKEFNIETGAECGDVKSETEIAMKSHSYKEVSSKTEGTTKTTTLKCSVCGNTTTKTETVQAAAPATTSTSTTSTASSTNSGSGVKCTRCGSYNTTYTGEVEGNHGTSASEYRCNNCGKDDLDVWH